MKGKTKIILTNVETGEQEIHEDENLVTNALDKLININVSMNYALNSYVLPIAEKALGGIMLFDEELTEDPGNIHFPTEAHLVGYAGRDVNASDAFRGSFNSLESGPTADGYVSVWDFGTTQANGTIKSVARTSYWAGQAPLYQYNSESSGSVSNGSPANDRSWYPIRYDGEYIYMLKGDSSTHEMRLARVRINMMRLGVADYSNRVQPYEVIASWSTEVTTYSYWNREDHSDPAREQTVYADDPLLYEDGHDGKLYCMFFGATRPYCEYPYDITYFTIKYDDESYEKSETTRVNTGTSFFYTDAPTYMAAARRYCGHVHNGTLYRISNDRKYILIIPLDNTGAYRSIRVIDDGSDDYIEDLHKITPRAGGVYIEVYHYTDTSYNRLGGILYPDGVFVLPSYSYLGQDRRDRSTLYSDSYTCDDDMTVWGYYTGDAIRRLWAANYLGTINNLGTTITKTAAQTMKIIYTLTDVDDEDAQNGGD